MVYCIESFLPFRLFRSLTEQILKIKQIFQNIKKAIFNEKLTMFVKVTSNFKSENIVQLE
jgi:hypothetical protein